MKLQWKEYKINLSDLYNFLVANIPEADGIVADINDCEIIEKSEFSQDTKDLIENFYNNMSGESSGAP